MDAPAGRIVHPVCLAPWFVADEDHVNAAVVELLEMRFDHLDVGDATEGTEEVHCRALSV